MWDFTSFYDQYCFLLKKNSLERFCDQETARKFYDFTNLLTEENSHTNLTAIREIPDIIAKHYADCLLAEPFFPQNSTVIDVGCGGGFPTIPLAIVRPDLKITAVDSTAKKINFVQKAVDSLELLNVFPVCARAESPLCRWRRVRRARGRFSRRPIRGGSSWCSSPPPGWPTCGSCARAS